MNYVSVLLVLYPIFASRRYLHQYHIYKITIQINPFTLAAAAGPSSLVIAEKAESGLSRRAAGEPCSTTRPSFSTTILSLSMIVLMRWAMVIMVPEETN